LHRQKRPRKGTLQYSKGKGKIHLTKTTALNREELSIF